MKKQKNWPVRAGKDASKINIFCNDPMFWDTHTWVNSVNEDRAVWSGFALFAILSAALASITLWLNHIVQILG